MPDAFSIDLSQTSWRPDSVQALVSELSRALGTPVAPNEVEFVGADLGAPADAPKEILDDDERVRGFCEAAASGGEGDGEATPALLRKVIRAELPQRIASELGKPPRKLALLATGRQISKFSGELLGVNDVDLSMKFFDCGHFRIKEASVPGGGGGGAAMIWEGRWEESETSVKLEFLLRCQEPQQPRRRSVDGVGTCELVPHEARVAELQIVGEEGSDDVEGLAGEIPTTTGGGAGVRLARAEFRSEANVVDQQRQSRSRGDDDGDSEDEHYKQMLQQVARRPPQPPKRPSWEDDWDSDEPRWPMYLGIVLFIVIIITFAYVWYEEKYGIEPPKEFDEL